jgi:hypothetical protein
MKPNKNLTVKKYIPTEFDFQCNQIFDTLDTFKISNKEQIQLLEQCIEYIRMEQVYENQ